MFHCWMKSLDTHNTVGDSSLNKACNERWSALHHALHKNSGNFCVFSWSLQCDILQWLLMSPMLSGISTPTCVSGPSITQHPERERNSRNKWARKLLQLCCKSLRYFYAITQQSLFSRIHTMLVASWYMLVIAAWERRRGDFLMVTHDNVS